MQQDKNFSNFNNQEISINRQNFITRSTLMEAGLAVGSSKWAGAKSKTSHMIILDSLSPVVNEKRRLNSLEMSPIGLGCMSMTSSHYNPFTRGRFGCHAYKMHTGRMK